MYQVTKDGTLIALVDEPRFITVARNGCFVQAPKAEARGIAINSTPYNLLGRESMRDDIPTVMCLEVDGGVYLSQEQEQLKADLAEADEAAIELYEANEAAAEVSAAQDEAIIELYEMIGG
jgi:hypothetical protein